MAHLFVYIISLNIQNKRLSTNKDKNGLVQISTIYYDKNKESYAIIYPN